MLKYTETAVTFAEVPNEISLCVNISGCPNKCPGCHSPYLREDIGKPLDWGSLNALININTGITCVVFMGGDAQPKAIDNLAYKARRHGLKTCWYSGNEELSDEISLGNFDFVKLGPYIEKFGPLDKPTTNQRFYKVIGDKLEDITHEFWNSKH